MRVMYVAREATYSSRIEGMQTNVEDAFKQADDVAPEQRDDWSEVQNYIQALNYAVERLDTLPLSNRLLKETHGILLQGVRGESKRPGEFRSSQNWIGVSLKNAVFVPPHHERVDELMADLEKFLHDMPQTTPPIKVQAVLGKSSMQVSQLLKLGRGAVVELDRKLGEAVDIYVNNRLVARGEVVMVEDNKLGVTRTEIVKADRAS